MNFLEKTVDDLKVANSFVASCNRYEVIDKDTLGDLSLCVTYEQTVETLRQHGYNIEALADNATWNKSRGWVKIQSKEHKAEMRRHIVQTLAELYRVAETSEDMAEIGYLEEVLGDWIYNPVGCYAREV